MVRHWRTERSRGWPLKAAVNLVGAIATAIVLVVVASVKFKHGAYLVLIAVPLLMLVFLRIKRHYQGLDKVLALGEGDMVLPRAVRHAVLVLVPRVHRGVIPAVVYAKTISPDAEAVFVEVDESETPRIQQEWAALNTGLPLTVLKSPWRSLVGTYYPVYSYLAGREARGPGDRDYSGIHRHPPVARTPAQPVRLAAEIGPDVRARSGGNQCPLSAGRSHVAPAPRKNSQCPMSTS